ncbi:hypothetical protein NP233_g6761 [Leucocoprinus birnbaumii]|uniref:Protein PNS1 n=1 Tax=Leucocoprinus birnbaumii TaxID=56174 RepID=A0AAD5VSR9_9AGAR|nr:hypothetical protein NP233_g6761 [Leucocoprinus birnbaumii]
MIVTSVFAPATLFISSVWAFVGSFMWDAQAKEVPTWGETTGLRLFAIIPLVLSLFTGRKLLNLPRELQVTSSTLTLTTHLLLANPFLLALSPAILLITLIGSIPFLTLVFRLLLYGYQGKYTGDSVIEGKLYVWANWAIFGAASIWLWSWGVARGMLRTSVASVIGAWYFADPDALAPLPMDTHTIRAATVRATGPSLGSICLSALLLTIIRILTLFTLLLDQLPKHLPPNARLVINGIKLAVGYLDGVTTALSKYALVYVGLTGDPFMSSARRARALTEALEAKAEEESKKPSTEPQLALLAVAPLTLSFPFALSTYLFVAHTLDSPPSALGASVLSGAVTALVGRFCTGLVLDAADTLFLCYCIDKDIGERKREEVFIIFEEEEQNQTPEPAPTAQAQARQSRRGRASQPEEILPLSPRTTHRTTPLPQQRHHNDHHHHHDPRHHRGPPPPDARGPLRHQPPPASLPPHVPTISPPPSHLHHAVSPPPHIAAISRAATGRALSPPPQPGTTETEDLDPFQLSYAEEPHQSTTTTSRLTSEPGPIDPSMRLSSRSPSPTPSLQLEPEAASNNRVPQQQQQQHQDPSKGQLRRKTSAEMNMKSRVWNAKEGGAESEEEGEEGEEVGLHKKFVAAKEKEREREQERERDKGKGHRRSGSFKKGSVGGGGETLGMSVLGSGSEERAGVVSVFPWFWVFLSMGDDYG